MDHRKLLRRYIQHVGDCEGVDFLSDTWQAQLEKRFTTSEIDELRSLARPENSAINITGGIKFEANVEEHEMTYNIVKRRDFMLGTDLKTLEEAEQAARDYGAEYVVIDTSKIEPRTNQLKQPVTRAP